MTSMQKNMLPYIVGALVLILVGYGLLRFMAQKSAENAQVVLDTAVGNQSDVPASSIEAGSYVVDVAASTMTWSGSKTLVENYVDAGTMQVKEGTIVVEGDTISQANFVFDMASIQATTMAKGGGQDALTGHLKSDDFFAVETYPTAEFVLTSAVADADVSLSHRYMLTGDLTIKGVTNAVSFPAVIAMRDGKLSAEAAFDLDRTMWNVRYGSDNFFDNLGENVISDLFTVAFTIVAVR